MTTATSGGSDPIRMKDVTKVYGTGDGKVNALNGVSISFGRDTFAAVMGPSGSGKSTLLHCAAGLDTPTSGSVQLDGTEVTGLSDRELTLLRRDRIGFVFQAFNLLPTLTALQNVTLPLKLAGKKADPAEVDELLRHVGLYDRRHHRPGELSGGQQQRAAIARALITHPAVVYADEPTGSLDTRSAREILELLRRTVRSSGRTVVMVTHDPVAASYADRVVFLVDGQIVDELSDPTAETVAERLARLGGAPQLAAADWAGE